MPEMEPTPIERARYKPAVGPFLRHQPLRARRTPPRRPRRRRGADLLDVLYPASNSPICPGCPMVPGVPDRDMRHPTCEVCRWPAVGIGQVHAWHCRFCRHWNQHGSARPRSAAVVLQLRRLSQPARALIGLAIPLVFGYSAPQGVEVWRDAAGNTQGAAVRGFVESRRLRGSERPLYVRGTVRRHPVLLVGGDGSDPYPLGLAEHSADLRAVGRWVTRVACPCGQEPPCIHAEALYAQVVSVIEARRRPPCPGDCFHVEVDLHA
jgi:ribosomal protein L37AE/L43A